MSDLHVHRYETTSRQLTPDAAGGLAYEIIRTCYCGRSTVFRDYNTPRTERSATA